MFAYGAGGAVAVGLAAAGVWVMRARARGAVGRGAEGALGRLPRLKRPVALASARAPALPPSGRPPLNAFRSFREAAPGRKARP
jgi:hypothetical protein